MRWPIYAFAAGLLAALLWALLVHRESPFLVPVFSDSPSACVRCRAVQHEERWLGVPVTRVERTAYTRWFEARRPASHEHRWRWGGFRRVRYLDGSEVAAHGRRHPLWELDPGLQRLFVGAVDSEQAARFYALMESGEHSEQQEALGLVRAHFSPNQVP